MLRPTFLTIGKICGLPMAREHMLALTVDVFLLSLAVAYIKRKKKQFLHNDTGKFFGFSINQSNIFNKCNQSVSRFTSQDRERGQKCTPTVALPSYSILPAKFHHACTSTSWRHFLCWHTRSLSEENVWVSQHRKYASRSYRALMQDLRAFILNSLDMS